MGCPFFLDKRIETIRLHLPVGRIRPNYYNIRNKKKENDGRKYIPNKGSSSPT
jgi:hypothetical protein